MKRFVPDSWPLTPKLRQYARDKKLTDQTIDDQEEAFRLCQFPRDILDWDRAWQRWIRNAIEWGKVQPMQEIKYNMPQEPSTDERKADIIKFEEQMKTLQGALERAQNEEVEIRKKLAEAEVSGNAEAIARAKAELIPATEKARQARSRQSRSGSGVDKGGGE